MGVGKQVIEELKQKAMQKILLIAIAGIGIILGVLLIMSVFGNSKGKALTVGTANMNYVSTASWEQFIRYLHMAEGGGEIYQNSSGVDCYKVTNGAVGYGVDIATHGKTLRALGYDTIEGSLIPIEDVDAIEEKVRNARYNDVKNLASSNGIQLTTYQIFALVSRTYNYGLDGGTGQATSVFKYPSTLTFVEAYKKYYSDIDNDEYYGDYTKTDFNNGLFTQYMTWLDYADTGTHPEGWEGRRKSEWCLFQTGYYGWGLQNDNSYPKGFDEYCSNTSFFISDIYNEDGTVNENRLQELEYALEINHNILIPSGKGLNSPWQIIFEGDSNNEKRRAVVGEFHGFSGNIIDGKPKGKNGLSTYQCTWWANGRASEYLSNYGTVYKEYPTNAGNGGEYYRINKENGWFRYGSEPKPNSLLSTASGSSYGHVLYIEAVDYVNKVYYASEAGSGYKWAGIQKYKFGHHNCTGDYGFIYLDEPIEK